MLVAVKLRFAAAAAAASVFSLLYITMFGGSGKHNYFGLRGTRLQIAVGALAGLDFLLFGYDQGVTGGLLTLDNFRQQFPTIDVNADGISAAEKSARSTYQGITVASYNLGCFCGTVVPISERVY